MGANPRHRAEPDLIGQERIELSSYPFSRSSMPYFGAIALTFFRN
jgi:hypothetical protein